MKTAHQSEMPYPLAVISNTIGTPSETFIHRHMKDLLPGKTAIIARKMESPIFVEPDDTPCLLLDETKSGFGWLFTGGLYFLNISKFSPVQISVEQFLRRYRVRTILSEYLDHSLKWLPVALGLGIRFYAHAHGYDVSKKLRDPVICQKYLQLEAADGIITMSDYSRTRLVDIGLNQKKIFVIPYGVDVPNAPAIRRNYRPIRCLAVGRMVPKKSPLHTLSAFHTALRNNPEIRLRLDYIGDGELFDKAFQYVRDHRLNNCIKLHRSQPNPVVIRLMRKSDMFLQHSQTDPETGDEEGLPVAILEAMANSLPVVSTRHAGIPEAVSEDVTGYLVDEGDIEGMAAKIDQLASNAALRARLGRAGWMRVKHHFSWEQEKSALLELLGL